jgi:copper(I)-binding protein
MKVIQNQQVFADLLVENARAKATIPGVKVSAGYLKLTNNSDQTMHFTLAKTSAAKYTEYHNMIMDNSKMVMRKVDVIEIKPQQSFVFKEKSYHLMFMGLNQRFTPGELITVTLIRENGQTYDILLPIMEMQHH